MSRDSSSARTRLSCSAASSRRTLSIMTPGADADRRSGDDGVVGGGGGVDGGGVDGGDGGDAPRRPGSGGGGVFLGRGGGDARGGDWCTGSWCTPKPSSSDEFDGGDGGDASAASTPAIRTEGCPPPPDSSLGTTAQSTAPTNDAAMMPRLQN